MAPDPTPVAHAEQSWAPTPRKRALRWFPWLRPRPHPIPSPFPPLAGGTRSPTSSEKERKGSMHSPSLTQLERGPGGEAGPPTPRNRGLRGFRGSTTGSGRGMPRPYRTLASVCFRGSVPQAPGEASLAPTVTCLPSWASSCL